MSAPNDIVRAAMLNNTQARSKGRLGSLIGKQLGNSPGNIDPAVVEVENIGV